MAQPLALLLTLLIESTVALSLLAATGWAAGRGWRATLAMVCAASLLTHPVAWALTVEWTGRGAFWARALPVEAGVCVAEGLFYTRMLSLRWWQGLVISVVANAASFGAGLLI